MSGETVQIPTESIDPDGKVVQKVGTNKDYFQKPNEIIEANYALTSTQQKIFAAMLERFENLMPHMDEEQLKDVWFQIPIREFVPDFNRKKGGRAYKLLEEQVSAFGGSTIDISTDKGFKTLPLVGEAGFVKDGTDVMACFNTRVIPLLVSMIDRGFSKLVKDTKHFKNKYAHRIYELITKNRNHPQVRRLGYYSITPEELRAKLKVPEKQYKRWPDFRKRVLEASREEIEKNTSLRYTIEYPKNGRSIKAIEFHEISVNTGLKTVTADSLEASSVAQTELTFDDPVSNIGNPLLESLFPQSRKEIEEKHTNEYIEYYFNKVKALESNKKLRSDFGNCLYSFLKNDEDQFYLLEQKKITFRREKERLDAVKEKAAKQKEIQERQKEITYEERLAKASALFRALSTDEQQKRIEGIKNDLPFLSPEKAEEQAIAFFMKEREE